jgi:hypothetical protein
MKIVNSFLLISNPVKLSCIKTDLEKQLVFLVKRMIQVRRFKFSRFIFGVFRLPVSCLVMSKYGSQPLNHHCDQIMLSD